MNTIVFESGVGKGILFFIISFILGALNQNRNNDVYLHILQEKLKHIIKPKSLFLALIFLTKTSIIHGVKNTVYWKLFQKKKKKIYSMVWLEYS